jgi:hypothetical protein
MVLVLLGAQGIGLWHRLAHDHHGAAATTSATATATETATATATATTFGHAEGDLQACRAFDHLALADIWSVAAPALVVVATAVPEIDIVVDGIAQARPGHYRARAPPAA